MNNIPMKSSSPISSTDLNNLNNTTGTAVESNNITNIKRYALLKSDKLFYRGKTSAAA